MSASTLPAGGISLHGHAAANTMDPDHHVAKSAMLFKLSQSMLSDLRKAASGQGGLQFVAGKTPKLQLGSRSVDLGVSPDAFRNELYTPSSSSPTAFHFETVISHRAEVSAEHASQSSTAADDASLATLQSQMDFLREEKKAKQTTISDSVLPELSRFEAAKRQKKGGLLGLHSSSGATSPSLSGAGTPRPGLAATSAPDDSVDRTKAMRTPVIHLLAMQPLSTSEITAQTHIPKAVLDPILSKVAAPSDGKWELMGKMYKELDVWAFRYKTQEDRQSAVDNAIRALDRQRIGKEDKLWQMLLPKEERGKGKVLSKLHLGAAPQPNRGLTPNWQPSPNPQTEDEEKAANTPRLGPSAAASKGGKAGAAKTGGAAMTKRLLSKDPKKAQKARAAEEAKEKRKREREAAATASDREGAPAGKRQKQGAAAVGKVASSKIKSAELVHSSDDEDDEGEEGEIMEGTSLLATSKNNGAVKPAPSPRPKAKASTSSPESSDEHVKPTSKAKPSTMASKAKPSASTPLTKSTTTSSPALKASKPATTTSTKTTTGKSTPPTTNGLPPSSKAANKSGLSPSKSHTRPPGPSPLGAARPRLASDVSDRSGIASRKGLKGGDTPKGLGITGAVNGSGARRRQDTVTSRESFTSTDGGSERAKVAAKGANTARKGAATWEGVKANGTPSTKGTPVRKAEAGSGAGTAKRKAATADEHEGIATKHRKTDSGSSASTSTSDNNAAKMPATTRAQKNTTNGTGKTNGKPPATAKSNTNGTTKTPAPTTTDRPSTSPSDAALFSSSSSTKSPPLAETISFQQGVNLAQKFKEEYYPAYAKLYDELAEREAKGGVVEAGERRKLWEMHRRLEGIKAEIVKAAQREGG